MLRRIRDSPFASMLPSLQRMYLRPGRLFTAHGPLRATPLDAMDAADAAGLRVCVSGWSLGAAGKKEITPLTRPQET